MRTLHVSSPAFLYVICEPPTCSFAVAIPTNKILIRKEQKNFTYLKQNEQLVNLLKEKKGDIRMDTL